MSVRPSQFASRTVARAPARLPAGWLRLHAGLLLAGLLLPGLLLPSNATAALTEDSGADDPLFADMPVVLSTARLRQPQSEAPAAVTILDRELIRLSGARTLPELLQLVPGMQIGMQQGHQASIGYHGLVDDAAHRMQVLIDGRSVYETALARVQWFDIPLVLADIDRIEVTRGPNSALYGANSFTAIVNIITLGGQLFTGTQLAINDGERGIRDQLLRHAGRAGDHDYRISAGRRGDDGFDLTADKRPRRDDYQANLFNLQIDSSPTSHDRLLLQLGLQDTDKQIQDLDDYEVAPQFHTLRNRNRFLLGRWQREISDTHQLQLRAYVNDNDAEEIWRSCPPRVFMSGELASLFDRDAVYTNALIAAAGSGRPIPPPPAALQPLVIAVLQRFQREQLSTTCGRANQTIHERRADIELQDTLTLSDTLRLVSGLSLRHDRAVSETYFGGRRTLDLARVFANAEWRASEQLLVHAGGTLDHENITGSTFSPRLALNWALDTRHSLRAVVTRAARAPDLYEEYGKVSYTLRDLDQPVNGDSRSARFYQTAQSPGGLDVEQVESRELGLFAHYENWQLDADIRLFNDRFTDLIFGAINVTSFDIGNRDTIEQRGHEVQINWRPQNWLRIFAGWTDIDHDKDLRAQLSRATAPRSQHALIAIKPATDWELALTWYALSRFRHYQHETLGLRLGWQRALTPDMQLDLAVNLRQRLDDDPWYDADNRLREKQTLWIQAALHF